MTSCGGGTSALAKKSASAALVTWLQRAQRAGYERHDLKVYMRQWSADATLTAARGPTAGRFDRTIDLTTIRATRAERFFRRPADGRTLRWQDVRVRIDGSRAEVRWRARSRHADGEELVAEVYELQRKGTIWRVTHNRFWPISTQETGRKVKTYTAKLWRTLDAWAKRKACYGGRCPSRLLSAWRFNDAWLAAVRLSDRSGGATAHAWLLRGICAVLSGHVDDARPSFEHAQRLDPALALPPWRSAAPLTSGDVS